MYAHHIKKAANHLLEILLEAGSVPYSVFYDETDETHRELAQDLGMSLKAFERAGGEALIDQAAASLADQGYVKITLLDEELPDGERDYEIELLEQGRAMLAAGKKPTFHDLDL